MTNWEFYKDNEEFQKICVCGSGTFGIDKNTGELKLCAETKCINCKFHTIEKNCAILKKDWLDKEYKEKESEVDWGKVKVDTPILVSSNGTRWVKRYFAEYKDETVHAFANGATSWSNDNWSELASWKYAKLAESEEK